MLTALTAIALLAASPALAQQQGNVTVASPECSSAIANPNCVVTIHASNASSPLPIKVRGDATVTIVVKKRPLDVIGFASSSKDIPPPDAAGAVFTALLPGLRAFVRQSGLTTDPARRNALVVIQTRALDPLGERLKWIAARQAVAATALKELETALKNVEGPLKDFQAFVGGDCPEEEFAALRLKTASILETAATHPSPAGLIQALKVTIAEAHKAFAAAPPPDNTLGDTITLLNFVASQQADLEADLAALTAVSTTLEKLIQTVSAPEFTYAKARASSHTIRPGPTGRARSSEVTLSLTDSLTGTKSTLGTVTALWATSRWETSTGVLFSNLRIRSFAAAPQWVNGVATRPGKDKAADLFVAETQTRPMVVPFALVHWNVYELPTDNNRVALLLTGGLGVNTHTSTADYALGISLSHRSLYLSLVAHRARDIRLTGGLTTGQFLEAPVPPLGTERFWTWTRALSLTIRVF